ncbi:probable trehalase isoform X1 [Miscanthus floridulus]|uniref:probable trehalase isoform X1 n=1 Tax=Miscanthus floridulus TaxID=154761 RepID=UPI00345A4459
MGVPGRCHPLLLFLTVLYGATTGAAAAGGGGGGSGDALLDLLQRVQSEALRALGPRGFDPKLYVDMPLAAGADLGAAAAALPLPGPLAASRGELDAFVGEYLAPAGSDLVAADTPDLALPEPRGFLPRVEQGEARAWAREVHAMWRNLTRRVAPGVAAAGPPRHTLLPLPGRAVVPGSGYRELYYWDSYWVVRGLLVSKMYETGKEVVLNLLSLVEKYGFVLNGARSYYTNRSQPPLLSSMIFEIYKATGDLVLVNKAFPSLLKEHSFWMSDVHRVAIRDNHGRVHNLTRYQASWDKPRPESATTDEQIASRLASAAKKEKFYHQIASAAESGWDFSSRWMRNPPDMTTLATTFIIPVDLNTFMYKMERDIEFFAVLIGEYTTSKEFSEAAKARQIAIDSILWNSNMEQWLDYWLPTDVKCQSVYQWNSKSQNHNIFASNFIPIWLNVHHSGDYTGFGWSNGVVLSFLEEFGWPRDKEIVCS